ncbi:MAG TPA: class I SAM-dependent methyltransferase [Oscillatoriaceae cyanobacterium]
MTFGLIDYWRMFRARGPRLPITYFLENQLFDLVRGIDTHVRVPHESLDVRGESAVHGLLYQCSWKSAIVNSFAFLQRDLGPRIADYHFVDVGCGKGKVPIVWQELAERNRLDLRITGVDYAESLLAIARSNHAKVFGRPGNFVHADILGIDFAAWGERFVFYLYNPFDAILLERFIAAIKPFECIVVYNNPVHAELFLRHGFTQLLEPKAWHPNATLQIVKCHPNERTHRPTTPISVGDTTKETP